MQASDLFNWPDSIPFASYFDPSAEPWQWVPQIQQALSTFDFDELRLPTPVSLGLVITGDVYIHPTVRLPPYAVIQGPAWIGADTEIRPGAFIRGNVIVGERCVLGNSCEYKNCLLLHDVESAHFNYIGDSILGNKTHLGAGVILANQRLDRAEVEVSAPEGRQPSALRKLGALLGDGAEVGCNAVLQPGTILGRSAAVMPTLAYGGYLPDRMMAYASNRCKTLPRRDIITQLA